MSRKNNASPETGTLVETPKRKRAVKSDLVIAMESQLKEARSLDKILKLIPSLSAWGCAQVAVALTKNQHYVPMNAPKAAVEVETQ